MEEVKDVRMDQREGAGAVLDALMSKIPGFGGYLEREHRRIFHVQHLGIGSRLNGDGRNRFCVRQRCDFGRRHLEALLLLGACAKVATRRIRECSEAGRGEPAEADAKHRRDAIS